MGEIKQALEGAPEAQPKAISELFQAVLGRAATQADIACWQGQIQQGHSVGEIRLALAQSPDAAKAIQGFYQKALGRDASAAPYW